MKAYGVTSVPRSAEHGFTSPVRSAEHGFTSPVRSAEHGFTLIEMMVALFIFAMLAAGGVMLLSFGVRAQAASGVRLDEVASVRRMSVLLAADFGQVAPRMARGTSGQPLRAFTGNDGRSDPLIMGYVRTGWSNPDGAPRASIQRVDLVLNEGRLERLGHDIAGTGAATATLLLADRVTAVTTRYRDAKGEWRPRWDNADLASLPAAIELTITQGRAAPLTLAFATGAGVPTP